MREEIPDPKPKSWETICISLYRADLKNLDNKVAQLRERGFKQMSRSELIRVALRLVNAETVNPKDSNVSDPPEYVKYNHSKQRKAEIIRSRLAARDGISGGTSAETGGATSTAK